MPVTHIITRGITDRTNQFVSLAEQITDDTEINSKWEVVEASPPALVEIDWKVTRANLKSVAITADQNCTIYTDNASPPTDTINLKAGQVLVWTLNMDGLADCPFSADVTKLLVLPTAPITNLQIWGIAHQQVP